MEFGRVPTTVAQAIKKADRHGFSDDDVNPLADALDEIAGQAGRLNPRILGRWVEKMQGRRIGGRYFHRIGLRRGVMHWSVITVSDQRQINTPKPTTPTTPACLERFEGCNVVGLVGDGVLNSDRGATLLPENGPEPVAAGNPGEVL